VSFVFPYLYYITLFSFRQLCGVALGLFSTAEEAARVRDKEALRVFGKYANLNFKDSA
jgi:hypothetical protein